MAYKKLKPHKIPPESVERRMRLIWKEEYCSKDVYTYDGILVRFYEDMFDHCFYESHNWKQNDKSILSLNRLEKMLWIKDTLQDKSALLKQGWNKNKKIYENNRRVSFIKGSYVVIISLNKTQTKARFITAYELQDSENTFKILDSPNWIPE